VRDEYWIWQSTMFAFRRIFFSSYLPARRFAGSITLALGVAFAGGALASPVSMLDDDGDSWAVAAQAPALVAADRSTVRPITELPDIAGGVGSAFDHDQSASSGEPASKPGLLAGAASGADQSGAGGALRDVLQSIVTLHQSDRKLPAAQLKKTQPPAGAMQDPGMDELSIDLRKLILDSEVAGTMLRSVVDIKSADANGATFSIFGLGNFALDVAPDLHAAIVSELSSGMGFRMSLTGDGRAFEGYPQATVNSDSLAGMPHEHVNIVRVAWNWLLEFLSSPVGALLSMSAAIAVFLWICVKSVVFLQRRASRYEHL
jgi:hypothetical protein